MKKYQIQNTKYFLLRAWRARAGQSLGEVLVGLTIGAILIGAASFLIVNSLRSNASLEKSQKGSQIAQELLDKVRSWSGADWFNIYNLSKGSTNKYFLNASGTSLSVVFGEESALSDDVTNGLIGYWKFDESTSTTAYDSSGNNKNGTLVNGVTRATSTCKISYCLSFDDVNDYVTTTAISYSNDVTMSVWFKGGTQTVSDWNYFIYNASNRFEFGTYGNTLNFKDNGAVGTPTVSAGSTFLDNQWHHAVGLIRSNVMEIWIDGLLISSRSDYPTGQTHSNELHYFGGNGSSRFWSGGLDDIRIYNRALSADEVKQLYQSSVYTRSFYVENVCRSTGATGEIVSAGGACAGGSADDPSTQKINIAVNWNTGVTTTQLTLADYLTRWKNAVFEQSDWSGGVDSSGSYSGFSSTYSSTTNTDTSAGVILDLP